MHTPTGIVCQNTPLVLNGLISRAWVMRTDTPLSITPVHAVIDVLVLRERSAGGRTQDFVEAGSCASL